MEVPLTSAEVAAHYDGFANGALWPNYHGGIVAPVYHRSEFEAEQLRPDHRITNSSTTSHLHDQLDVLMERLRAAPDLEPPRP